MEKDPKLSMEFRNKSFGGDETKILPDLCHFRSSLADDAADQLVGDRHLVGLLAARGTTLATQHGKR